MTTERARADDSPEFLLDADGILNAMPDPILVVDEGHGILFANSAAEQLFEASATALAQRNLSDLVPYDSPLLALLAQARENEHTVSEFGVEFNTPWSSQRPVDIQVSALSETSGHMLVRLQQRGIAAKMDQMLTQRGAGRSVAGLAAVLAHEVKNPLSGIRGAAQLLEQNADEDDRVLTRLICDETDRICALVDRMEEFTDYRTMKREAVNVYRVLEHVRRVAENGFASALRISESYDPSLPAVLGDRDQLVQVLLNLVKNAAEAAPAAGGEIVLSTSFRHGVRVQVPGGGEKVGLPIEIAVQDNGPGIPDDLRPYLFDPFVTTKETGSGLGLALAAKIIGDHGGIIDFESEPRRTVFRILLPMHRDGEAET